MKKNSKLILNFKIFSQLRRKCYKCYYAKSFDQLPSDNISELNPELISYYSGPDNGISDVSLVPLRKKQPPPSSSTVAPTDQNTTKSPETQVPNEQTNTVSVQLNTSTQTSFVVQPNANTTPINTQQILERNLINECLDSFAKCGIKKWNLYHHRSYGIACSLYENNPVTNQTVGEPIADTYAILTRKNSSFLILADGVNWGPRSRLAARSAVRASMNYINRNLFFSNSIKQSGNDQKYFTTHDIFKIMCRSFDAAQEYILQRKGTMTTLCCSVVVKLKDQASSSSPIWAVCTLSIGDSTAYVFNRSKGVFELSFGARNLNDDRDMRNVGGALGHVYGNKPDVSNLNYSVMYVKESDIVFLVSDGVSDNLDPIVSQTARRRPQNENELPNIPIAQNVSTRGAKLNRSQSQSQKNLNKNCAELTKEQMEGERRLGMKSADDQTINLSSLPEMSPYERYVCSLAHMNEILLRNKTLNETVSAQETCAILIEHVMKLTAEKRGILEEGLAEAAKFENEEEKMKFQAGLRERVQKIRGKLDHASIVAYEVGTFT